MSNGNPRCRRCNGRGGVYSNGRWRKCECVSGSRAERDAQRAMNSIGTRGYVSPFKRDK